MRIYAVVEEQEEHLFVTTLTGKESETLSEKQVEDIARNWCNRHNPPLTFVDVVY